MLTICAIHTWYVLFEYFCNFIKCVVGKTNIRVACFKHYRSIDDLSLFVNNTFSIKVEWCNSLIPAISRCIEPSDVSCKVPFIPTTQCQEWCSFQIFFTCLRLLNWSLRKFLRYKCHWVSVVLEIALIYRTCNPALRSLACFLLTKAADWINVLDIGSFSSPVPIHCLLHQEEWLLLHADFSVRICILNGRSKHPYAHAVLSIIPLYYVTISLCLYSCRLISCKSLGFAIIVDFVWTIAAVFRESKWDSIVVVEYTNLFVLKWSTHLKRCEPSVSFRVSKWDFY